MIISWTGCDMHPRNPEAQILAPVEICNLYNPIMLLGICRQEDSITYHRRTWNLVKFSTSTTDTTNHYFQNSQPTTLPQPQANDQIGRFMFILKDINNCLGVRISGINPEKSPRLKQQHQKFLIHSSTQTLLETSQNIFQTSFFKLFSNYLKTNFAPENLQTGMS